MSHTEGNYEPHGEFDVPLRVFCLPQNGCLMFPVGVLRVDGSRGGRWVAVLKRRVRSGRQICGGDLPKRKELWYNSHLNGSIGSRLSTINSKKKEASKQ